MPHVVILYVVIVVIEVAAAEVAPLDIPEVGGDMVNSCGWRQLSGGGDLGFDAVVEDDTGNDIGQ